MREGTGQYVAFEACCYHQPTGTGWSVVVNGLAEIVADQEEGARPTPPAQE